MIFAVIPFDSSPALQEKIKALEAPVYDDQAPPSISSRSRARRENSRTLLVIMTTMERRVLSFPSRTISDLLLKTCGNGWKFTRMAIDRQDSESPEREKAVVPSTTPRSATPSPSQESQWIVHSLNQISDRINEVAKTVNDIEIRLRHVERYLYVAFGVLLAGGGIWAVLRLLFSTFDVTVTQRS